MQELQFPLLNCNYDFTASDLDRKIFPYHILQKGNLKIGIIGAGIRIKGLIDESMVKGIVYHDPIPLTEQLAKELKQKGCHIVVCLSHLGFQYENSEYPDDITLAQKTKNIDVIIGGHTHTFMDAPLLLKNLAKKNVLIHQVGWAGLRLGVLKLSVNLRTREIKYEV
jgi:5'-nucleotidase